MAKANDEAKRQVYKEFYEATGQTYKVTRDTTVTPVTMPKTDSELDGGDDDEDDKNNIEISYMWTDNIAAMTKTNGIDDLLEFYVMHACIQSDPGEPTTW
jgi:hypothetical protein